MSPIQKITTLSAMWLSLIVQFARTDCMTAQFCVKCISYTKSLKVLTQGVEYMMKGVDLHWPVQWWPDTTLHYPKSYSQTSFEQIKGRESLQLLVQYPFNIWIKTKYFFRTCKDRFLQHDHSIASCLVTKYINA